MSNPPNAASGRRPLDAATLLEPLEPGRYRGPPSQAYTNMVGPFAPIRWTAAYDMRLCAAS